MLQSRLLTGILTGTWKWNRCGDTQFADRRSGKPLSSIAKAEAERLAKVICGSTKAARIKTKQHPVGNDQPTDAMPLTSSDESLVAGNVTGGGGKATRKTT